MTIKRHIFTAAAIIAASCAVTANSQVKTGKAVFPVTTHDFGVIMEKDGMVTCRFAMVNEGDAPIMITDARANCGCTTPKYPHKPTAPGDTAWIEVSFDPKGRPGTFDKKVHIDTNTPERKNQLRITGTVIGCEETLKANYPYEMGKVRVKNKIIALGDVGHTQSKSSYVEAYNTSTDTIHPTFSDVPENMSVLVHPKEVPPGQQYIYSVVLQSDKRGAWGHNSGVFKIGPGDGSEATMDVEVIYNVRETFGQLTAEQLKDAPKIMLSEQTINLPPMSANDDKPLTMTVKMSNRGNSPLVFRRIYSTDSRIGLKTKKKEIKKNHDEALTITLTPADYAEDGYVNAKIEIITNDPDYPVTTLKVLGEVNKPQE